MDLKYTHGTQIFCVRACQHDDAADLVAIAGDNSVEVIQCVRPLAFELSAETDIFAGSEEPQGDCIVPPGSALHGACVVDAYNVAERD